MSCLEEETPKLGLQVCLGVVERGLAKLVEAGKTGICYAERKGSWGQDASRAMRGQVCGGEDWKMRLERAQL